VTGVLPVALQESTKTLQATLTGGKEYICVMKLHGDVEYEKVIRVFKEFVGEIYQRPPLRSSVKRQVRTRTIYYNHVLQIKDRNVLFKMGCQAGTYVRKIAHDIGEVLGCGAHVVEFRRTRSGFYTEDSRLVTLHDLSDAQAYWKEQDDEQPLRSSILPVETAVALLPKVWVKDSAVDAICHGAHLAVPGVSKLHSGIKEGDLLAMITLKDELVALGEAQISGEKMLEEDHGLVARTVRVIMATNTYPKAW
jgi:H/ACA ribonucleoprotein complex subunit 4